MTRRNRFRRLRTTAVTLVTAGVVLAGCAAQPEDAGSDDFPNRPVTVMIGSEPGGTLDTQFRAIQPFWEEELGQSLVPEYVPGGQGEVARTRVFNAAPDGYTIGASGIEQHVFSIVTGASEYAVDDFGFLGRQTYQPVTLAVRADSSFETLQDVIDAAADAPGEIRIGMGNIASDKGLTVMLIQEAMDVEFTIIPFDGGNASRLALLAGDIDVVASNVFTTSEMGDEIRTLAIHAPTNEYPELTNDAPTLEEALGVDVGIASNGGSGGYFFASALADENPEALRVLIESLQRAMANPAFAESLGDRAAELGHLDGDGADALMMEQYEVIEANKFLFDAYIAR